METVPIRELAHHAGAVIEQVRTSGRPTLVTKRGVPVAVIQPVDLDELERYLVRVAPEYVGEAPKPPAGKATGRGRTRRRASGRTRRSGG
jgi:prevent-host-death family protein